MTVRTNVTGATNFVLQEAIGGYADEAYTFAKKLTGTGIVGTNPQIDPSTETFVGQIRWNKPINPNINIASLTDAADGLTSDYSQAYLRYIKTVRTHGARKVNMQEVVTQVDGLAKVGRDFGEIRAQDEHNALLAVCRGVAISEALNGAAVGSGVAGLGGQTFDNDPTDSKYGFYVDIGASQLILDHSASEIGAQRATAFLEAFGKAYKDFEPEYAYLLVSPEVYASLRSANLIDADRVRDGSVDFNTIFQGKFRLIQTRAAQGFSAAELTKLNTGAGVDIVGTKTSFIILPGSIAMAQLAVPEPTEIMRNAKAYKGGGTTEIWYRWGYVLVPAGYDWVGSENAFPSDAEYQYVKEGILPKTLVSATNGLAATTGTFVRRFSSALSLGILPIFHS